MLPGASQSPGVRPTVTALPLSIVVPVYNEVDNIRPLGEEVAAALGDAGLDYEIIWVDDGSLDGTFDRLAELSATNSRQKVIRLRRNFGQTAAMAAGFAAAAGEVVVPMDGDLQNDPRDIPRLLAKLAEGYDVVSGWRQKRQDGLLRRVPSRLANALISQITGVALHDYGCTLKAYRREVLAEINLYGELHRFVPALASQAGARVAELPVNHRARRSGYSKYGLDRTLPTLLDLVTVKFLLRYATRPMQLFGKWAFVSMALAVPAAGATLYMKWVAGLSMNRTPLLLLTALLIFSGVNFLALGLLGELLTRTYHEAQAKPVYAIRETRNLDVLPLPEVY